LCSHAYLVFRLSQCSVAILIRWGGWSSYLHLYRSFQNPTVISENYIKICWFLMKLQTKITCLLFGAHNVDYINGWPFVKRFALCYQTVVCPVLSVSLSVTLVYCGQTVGWIKMKLGVQVGLGSDHIVLDGDPAPPPPKGHSPPIFGHICCGQMDGWIKMPLGMEVGLSLGDCVRWGPCSPLPKKGAVPPIFGPSLLWPNGCMYQDTTWYRGRPQPRRHCVRWGPSSLP